MPVCQATDETVTNGFNVCIYKRRACRKNIDSIVVEAAGVGYLIYIPTQYFDMLPDEGEDVKIYTYLCVREDAMILYGFLSKDDLEIFKLLITVSGIGPKGGLAILSTLPADDLRFAILSGDSKAISKAPGIGAKTAQRVILDLKDKLSLEDAFEKKLENQTSGAAVSMNSTVKMMLSWRSMHLDTHLLRVLRQCPRLISQRIWM